MELRTKEAKIIILSGKARSGKDTSMEIIKKIQEGNDTPILLDEYENIMYDEYIKLMN